MKPRRVARSTALLLVWLGLACGGQRSPASTTDSTVAADRRALTPASARIEPLASWNEGATKRTILEFVAQVSDPKGSRYVPPAERIAVFDNDGTLWAEHPIYFQVVFVTQRVREIESQHPEWKTDQPFRAVLENDHAAMAQLTERQWLQLMSATQADLTPEEYDRLVRRWLATAHHPRFRRRFTALVYQPMLELLAYLRQSGFKTFIVTGGEVDFVRAFSTEVYGIPPEQVIGSSFKYEFIEGARAATLERLPELGATNNAQAKPENIQLHIGRRPIIAVGNSDGDLQMLEYSAAGKKPALMLLVHHDDATREFKYDRDTGVGRLDKALDQARRRNWSVISMKNDFGVVFPFEKKAAP